MDTEATIQPVVKQLWSKKKFKSGQKCDFTFTLKLSNVVDSLLTKDDVERAIYSAMSSLHGMMGVAHHYELKSYDQKCGIGVIEISANILTKLWTALTLQSDINDVKCLFTINDIKLLKTDV